MPPGNSYISINRLDKCYYIMCRHPSVSFCFTEACQYNLCDEISSGLNWERVHECCNRKQFVTIANSSSEERFTVMCGVPQGSVLGPFLFFMYINDFNQASSVLDLHLFADDSNLFYSHRSLQICT